MCEGEGQTPFGEHEPTADGLNVREANNLPARFSTPGSDVAAVDLLRFRRFHSALTRTVQSHLIFLGLPRSRRRVQSLLCPSWSDPTAFSSGRLDEAGSNMSVRPSSPPGLRPLVQTLSLSTLLRDERRAPSSACSLVTRDSVGLRRRTSKFSLARVDRGVTTKSPVAPEIPAGRYSVPLWSLERCSSPVAPQLDLLEACRTSNPPPPSS